VLEANGLGKRYGSRWIFRNISFQLQKGDRLAILGSNGTGKSTLLRCVAGLLTPNEGKLKMPEGDPRTTLGMAAIEMALYPALSCREHLSLTADLRGCDDRCDELLARVGLSHAAGLYSSQLSTGMKSRLRLAMAIQAEPLVLLLDEPGAAMDEAGKSLLDGIVEEQAGRGVLIYATNDPLERRHATYELALEHTVAPVG
jgi:ABC-type multidrug transport system ATPase subunit